MELVKWNIGAFLNVLESGCQKFVQAAGPDRSGQDAVSSGLADTVIDLGNLRNERLRSLGMGEELGEYVCIL